MSPLRMGSATVTVVTAAELADRAAALSQACTEGARELEPAQVDQAVNLVDKVRERTSIAGGHTVVALAGATGSGKSSLFNALVAREARALGCSSVGLSSTARSQSFTAAANFWRLS